MSERMIDNYRFGNIIINGEIYQKDLIIFPDRIMPNWIRKQGHSLDMDDLKGVVTAKPKVIIIGTGMFGRMAIPQKTLEDLETAGIEVIIQKTEMACQIFNQRHAEGDIIAALHLTC